MAGPDGLPPTGSGPPKEDRQDLAPDVTNQQEKQGDRAVQETYASKVPRNNNKRMKLNVFNIFLERQDSTTTCQKKNMRNFCSRKCQSIRSSFFNIDTFGFSKIQIKLTNNLNL